MMNNMNQSDAEREVYLSQSRIRLFHERNQYKAMAEQAELELEDARVKANRVIAGLLVILVCVLLGVLFYATKYPISA